MFKKAKNILKIFLIIVLIGNTGQIFAYSKPSDSSVSVKHQCCWPEVTNTKSGNAVMINYGNDKCANNPVNCPSGSVLRIYYGTWDDVMIEKGKKYAEVVSVPVYYQCYKMKTVCSWYQEGVSCPSSPPS